MRVTVEKSMVINDYPEIYCNLMIMPGQNWHGKL